MKTAIYKFCLANDGKKVENLINELGDKVKILDKGEYMDTIEVTIEDATDVVRVFYAGLFCGMDKARSC